MNFACPSCGARGEVAQDCPACGEGVLLDIRRAEVIEMLQDTESRLNQNHNDRLRWLAVILGIFIGVGINFVPGFRWPFKLPLFGHWWIFTIVTTMVVMQVLEKKLARRQRFPYISDQPSFDSDADR